MYDEYVSVRFLFLVLVDAFFGAFADCFEGVGVLAIVQTCFSTKELTGGKCFVVDFIVCKDEEGMVGTKGTNNDSAVFEFESNLEPRPFD